MNTIKIKKEDLKLLQELGSATFEPVYVHERNIVTIPSGSWNLKTKEVPAKGDSPAFMSKRAEFSVEGVERPFTAFFKSGQEPDEDGDIRISLYVAKTEWPCSNGKVIEKGTKKTFATMM